MASLELTLASHTLCADRAHRACTRLAALLMLVLLAPACVLAKLPDRVRFGVAVESGDVEAVKAWLAEGLNPEFPADRVGTGLMIAAWEGNIEMMALFVAHGANVNAMNANREQPLMHAAWNGHLEAVRWLLDHGAQVNRKGLEWSALHYAVFAGHQDVAQTLIARGADINALSTNGSSPLMMASREGHEKIAKLLVDLGADTSIKNDWGDDALTWAMRYGNPQIAKIVATPERFATAARTPREQFGTPTRSLPPPQRLAEIMKAIREAEAAGRSSLDLQEQYLALAREMRAARAAEEERARGESGTPAGLEIRAQRGAPGREEAILIYDRGASTAGPLESAPGSTTGSAPGSAGP
jgi:uncharacterized protein